MIRYFLYLVIFLFAVNSASGQICPPSGVESIVNGGFESGAAPSTFGPHTLFVPNGSPPTNYSSSGNYYIGYSSKVFNYGFPSDVHPHSGSKMLMIDAKNIVNAVCWKQTIKVIPGQTYFFSAWLTSLSDGQRCQLQFQVKGNNDVLIAPIGPSQTAPDVGVWGQVYGTWNSGMDTSAVIQLSDYNPSGYGAAGNDFAVDDISFFNGCGKLVKGPKADFGADSLSLCWGGGSLDLNTNVTADAINKFTWFKDSVQLSNSTNALDNVKQTGTYTVCIDSATCLNQTQVKVTSNFFVDLGPNLNLCSPPTTILNTGITFPANFQIDWKENGVVIPGETGTNLTVTQAGTYKVEVIDKTGGLCHGTDSVTITSSLPAPNDVKFCPPTTTTALLSVTGSGHYVWWDAATGGNKIGSGTTYTATGLSNTTVFYVQDTTYTYYKAGLFNNISLSGGGINNMAAQNFENFKATQNCILDTIAVDMSFTSATSSPQIQIQLTDNTLGSTITNNYTAPNQSAGEHYVDVPISLPLIQGHSYQIVINIPTGGGTMGTMRYGGFNTANYPMVFPVVTLTSGQATSVYAGLFNWRLHSLSTCDRMPVKAIKSCPLTCVVPQNPVISPAGPYNYCQGTSISKVFTASVSNSSAATFYYEFFRNGISVQSSSTLNTYTATQDGGYYVIVTDLSNPTDCNAQTAKVIINLNSNPTVTAVGGTACSGTSITVSAAGANTYSWSNGLSSAAKNTVSPTITTTYTVTGTDANNCTNTAQAVVTIVLQPTVTAGGGSFCIGGSTTVTANGASSYTWSNGLSSAVSNTVNPTITTTYTVTGTVSLNCANTAQAVVTVNSLPIPAVSKDTTICKQASVTLTASGGTTYMWDNGLGAGAAQNVSPTINTIYSVTVSDINGCSATDAVGVTVNDCNCPSVQTKSVAPLCSYNAQISLDTITVTTEPGSWSITSFPPGTNPGSISSNVFNAIGKDAGTYELTFTLSTTPPLAACPKSSKQMIQINPLPGANAGNNDSVCNGQTYVLTASVTGSSSYTYLWSENNATGSLLTISPSVTNTYTVTVQDNIGCSEVSSVIIKVNPALTPTITSTKSILCPGDSSTVTVTGGGSYLWQTGETTDNITVAPTTTQIYAVTITNIYGCKGDTGITINVLPAPIPHIIGPAAICNGASAILSVNGSDSYLWSTTETINPITIKPTIQTTYSISATNGNGCKGTDQLVVIINPLPTANAGNNDSVCSGQTYVLTASASGSSGYSFLWSENNSSGSLLTISPQATKTYTVTVQDNNNCTDVSSVVIKVNPIPTPSITATKDLICLGEKTIIKVSGGISYTWQTGETTDNITVSPVAKQTYIVTVQNFYGCKRDTSKTIDVSAVPGPQIIGSPQICNGASEVLSVNGSDNYQWSTMQTGASITISPIVQTTYKLTATNSSGCFGTDQLVVSISPLPTANFIAQPITGCQPLTVTLTDQSNSSVHIKRYNWDFGDPSSGVMNTSTAQSPSHLYNMDGSFNIKLQVTTDFDCKDAQNNTIIVKPSPQAAFTFTPSMPTSFNPNVQFTDNSINAISWAWNFRDDNSSDNLSVSQNPNHSFSSYGDFPVQLIVEAGNGCNDTAVVTVHVIADITFYAPNAFTPNNDRLNDEFLPVGTGINKKTFQMYIYSRWGEEIFKTNTYQAWDGRANGGSKICPEGIYSWLVIFQDESGEGHRYSGFVTLVY